METKIITNKTQLNARIATVCKSLNTAHANLQQVLVSAIWHGIAHGSNGYADTILRSVPERLKSAVKTYLTECGPFAYNAEKQVMGVKKKTEQGIDIADKHCADLPDWQTFKKAKEVKAFKTSANVNSLVNKLKKAIAENTFENEDEAMMAHALLSYVDNIRAGLTKEKVIADAQLAYAESLAVTGPAAVASVQTQQVITEVQEASKQAA